MFISRRSFSEFAIAQALLFLAIADFLCIILCSIIAYVGYIQWYLHTSPSILPYLLTGILTALLTVLFAKSFRVYKLDELITLQTPMARIATAILLAINVTIGILFVLKTSSDFSRMWIALWFILCLITMPMLHAHFKRFIKRKIKKGEFEYKVALYGPMDESKKVFEYLKTKNPRIRNANYYPSNQTNKNINVIESLIQNGQANQFDHIYIVHQRGQNSDAIKSVMDQLCVLPQAVSLVITSPVETIPFNSQNYIILPLQYTPFSGSDYMAKTIFDLVITIPLIVVATPFFLLIALAIKLDSKGPVFFKQRRHGYNHEIFYIYKFRSMKTMDDGDIVKQASKDDDRITRVGRILRRTSIDETPQLLNVLNGTMSLIGPRPHAISHNDQYTNIIDRYSTRHRVKPGITGWAQINGFRGETTDPTLMVKRVEYDLYYISNWSLTLDMEIALRTAGLAWFQKNAY